MKRHLDIYDFEMALNEIADHSTITLDFSRQYGARLHQTQRSGIAPGTLPAITEIDDLMNKNRQTMEALARLRETLVAHQTAYFQQAQENLRLNQDSKRNDSVHQQDESKAGGFAGAEPKKRRGVSINCESIMILTDSSSGMLPPVDATAVIGPRHQSGDVVQMELVLSAMLADSVRRPPLHPLHVHDAN